MLHKLKNWCREWIFNPGLLWDCDPSIDDKSFLRRTALGGPRKNLRCASKVVGLVGCMTTLAVDAR